MLRIFDWLTGRISFTKDGAGNRAEDNLKIDQELLTNLRSLILTLTPRTVIYCFSLFECIEALEVLIEFLLKLAFQSQKQQNAYD
jgi:hypothetical protein